MDSRVRDRNYFDLKKRICSVWHIGWSPRKTQSMNSMWSDGKGHGSSGARGLGL